jgi:hypothetical protein
MQPTEEKELWRLHNAACKELEESADGYKIKRWTTKDIVAMFETVWKDLPFEEQVRAYLGCLAFEVLTRVIPSHQLAYHAYPFSDKAAYTQLVQSDLLPGQERNYRAKLCLEQKVQLGCDYNSKPLSSDSLESKLFFCEKNALRINDTMMLQKGTISTLNNHLSSSGESGWMLLAAGSPSGLDKDGRLEYLSNATGLMQMQHRLQNEVQHNSHANKEDDEENHKIYVGCSCENYPRRRYRWTDDHTNTLTKTRRRLGSSPVYKKQEMVECVNKKFRFTIEARDESHRKWETHKIDVVDDEDTREYDQDEGEEGCDMDIS